MKISEHITYEEATHSFTAKRLGIKNNPTKYQQANMEVLAAKVFEPLREWVGGAIKVNSFYRSRKLNEAIGGSPLSQHCEGRAIDIDDVYGHKTNAEMFNYIKDNLDFDQLIWEFGNKKNPDWVHVSYVDEDSNRKNVLIAEVINGVTHYKQV